MPHARQQIREAAAGLVTGLVTTGANVFQSRVRALQTTELPALRVFTTSEQINDIQAIGAPKRLIMDCDLVVEGIVRTNTNLDDLLDTISEEVQTALGNSLTLGIGAKDTVYQGADITISDEGDQPTGVVAMRFVVTYIVAENAPGTLL